MAQRLADGSQFDTFRIIRLIGKGGMGEVYEAYEDVLNRQVALKIIVVGNALTNAQLTEPELINSFIKEARTLAQLNHPNVVTIFRLGSCDGLHFIAMEYISGKSLRTMIREKKLDLKRALEIFEDILNGTKALHDKNIIHRDLKPMNILVSDKSEVKIVDFGIAESKIDKNEQHINDKYFVGSTYYVPPEIIRGGKPTFQSDIWCLGVILFEMLTGFRPHMSDTPQEVMQKAVNEDVRFALSDRARLPANVQKFTLKMCERDPKFRHASVQAILDDLKALKSRKAETVSVSDATTKLTVEKRSSAGNFAYTLTGFLIFIGLFSWVNRGKPLKEWFVLRESTQALPAPIPAPAIVVQPAAPVVVPPVAAMPKPIAQPKPQLPQVKIESSNQVFQLGAKSSLNWQTVSAAGQYKLQISTDVNFATRVTDISTPETNFSLNKFAPGEYYWRVKATKLDDPDGPFSIIGQFKIEAPLRPIAKLTKPAKVLASKPIKKAVVRTIASVKPKVVPAPKLDSPLEKISIPSQGTIVTPIIFKWSKIEAATQYKLEFSKTSDFKQVIYRQSTSSNQFVFDQALPAGTVYWRVRATDADENDSVWSTSRSFIIEQ